LPKSLSIVREPLVGFTVKRAPAKFAPASTQ